MDALLSKKIDLLVQNRKTLADSFTLMNDLNYVASSLVLTGMNKEADVEALKDAEKILKAKTSVFSSFQSTMSMIITIKMAYAGDPESYIENVVEVFNKILGRRIIESHSMVLAAMSLVDLGKQNVADTIIEKMREILDRMSKVHPFLTDDNDITFALLLAMTDKDVNTIINEMEECYTYLKKTIKVKADSNSIQGLSEIILLSDGDLIEKCDKAAKLFDTFAKHGAKYGDYYEFASLGALLGIDMDMDELVDTIIEVANTLKPNKGFGDWAMSERQRLMFAAMIVAEVMMDNSNLVYNYAVGNAVISNTIAEIVAEELAVMTSVMIMASQSSNNTF